ncbi:MAG: GNAT family N-acetyltransferase [Thermoleophilia bacterium]|nr:GNAT family N-acetyltransferase [Thermoleophilia bacterium]
MIRPDGRRFVRVSELSELSELPDGEVYCTLSETDSESLARCERLGFVVSRRESRYLLRTEPVRPAVLPEGVRLVTADEVELERLRLLDDALRQDVPGTDGWRWEEAGFRGEFDDAYDPSTYLVAVAEDGEYVGLVRVWHNPAGPRLGMIGVLPGYRRRGVARALLASAFAALRARGLAEVSTEIDDDNEASKALLLPLGARRVGGSLELVRR